MTDLPISPVYRRLRLIRAKWNPVVRAILAGGGALLTAVGTGQWALVREMARRLWRGEDTLLALRRGVWYLRRGWLRLPLGGKDAGFDVTTDLTPVEVAALAKVVARGGGGDLVLKAGDRALVAARQLAQAPQDAQARGLFGVTINDLLDHITVPAADAVAEPNTPKTALSHTAAIEALEDFARACPKEDVPWFILSGTFLGLIRENGFLPHDYDIDVGVMAEDTDVTALLDRLSACDDFALRKIDTQPPFPGTGVDVPRPMLMKLVHWSGVPVDVFIHYQTGPDEVVHGSSLHHWINTPFDLTAYEMEGVPVLGPKDADRYLTENYGDWRTPVTEFNCTTDTGNLSIVRHPLTLVSFLRRLAREARIGNPRARKLAAELQANGLIRPRPDAPDRFELSFGLD